MPVRIKKLNDKYRVTHGGKVSAKSTTKARAKRQANLLRAVEHGWKPTGAKARDLRKKPVSGSKPYSHREKKRGYRIIEKNFLKKE